MHFFVVFLYYFFGLISSIGALDSISISSSFLTNNAKIIQNKIRKRTKAKIAEIEQVSGELRFVLSEWSSDWIIARRDVKVCVAGKNFPSFECSSWKTVTVSENLTFFFDPDSSRSGMRKSVSVALSIITQTNLLKKILNNSLKKFNVKGGLIIDFHWKNWIVKADLLNERKSEFFFVSLSWN